MKTTNTKNRVIKEIQINDIVFINDDKYQILGETKSGWKLNKIDGDPKAKQTQNWNKNTFAKRFFFNDKYWSFIRNGKMPNMDYL